MYFNDLTEMTSSPDETPRQGKSVCSPSSRNPSSSSSAISPPLDFAELQLLVVPLPVDLLHAASERVVLALALGVAPLQLDNLQADKRVSAELTTERLGPSGTATRPYWTTISTRCNWSNILVFGLLHQQDANGQTPRWYQNAYTWRHHGSKHIEASPSWTAPGARPAGIEGA